MWISPQQQNLEFLSLSNIFNTGAAFITCTHHKTVEEEVDRTVFRPS